LGVGVSDDMAACSVQTVDQFPAAAAAAVEALNELWAPAAGLSAVSSQRNVRDA